MMARKAWFRCRSASSNWSCSRHAIALLHAELSGELLLDLRTEIVILLAGFSFGVSFRIGANGCVDGLESRVELVGSKAGDEAGDQRLDGFLGLQPRLRSTFWKRRRSESRSLVSIQVKPAGSL